MSNTKFTALAVSLLLELFFHSSTLAQINSVITDTTGNKNPENILLILVQGNYKTKEEIILREMKLHPGVKFDWQTLEEDRLRIQNLGIFNRVEIDMVPTPNGSILVVSVSEMWYIFPYPIIFRNDRDWGRVSVGAGLLYTNFRGRKELIDFSFWLGFNPSIRLSYSNPWIFGERRLYAKFSIFAQRIRNRSFTVLDSTVNENQIGFDWSIGKRFGHFTYLDVTTGYKRLTFSPATSATTLSESGRDQLPYIGFSFKHDSRDLWEYAHRGHYIRLWATKTGWFGNTVDYGRFGADLRKYFPVGSTTLAFRTATNLSDGEIPVYSQVHFGFGTRIRGHFKKRVAGENLLLASTEFRFPIFKIRYFDWGTFEGMGTYGSNFRLGLNGGIFFDTGALWFQNQSLDGDRFMSGWGAGLHIFLPYNGLMRLEYAFDEDWDGQFIIDALISF